jgi:hypothetical protein
MDLIIRCAALLIGGLVIWSLWRAAQPRPAFVVRITGGEPYAVAGTVTPAFLQRVREVAADCGVTTGRVAGLPRGRRIRLAFSRHIPKNARQQLRNWWVMSGWPAGKSRAER